MRRNLIRGVELCLLTVAFWALVAAPASAYIDPGSGSYLFQVLVAAALAAAVSVRAFWERIRDFFSSIFIREK